MKAKGNSLYLGKKGYPVVLTPDRSSTPFSRPGDGQTNKPAVLRPKNLEECIPSH